MSATESVPSSREFTFVGVTYGIFATGLFMLWPLLIAIVLAYVKRRDVEDTLLESHYRWMIRTFWWWAAWWVLIVAAIVTMVVPDAAEAARAARSGDYIGVPWSVIGAAVVGGLGLAAAWLWALYRVLRGALRLADGRAVP